MDFEEKLREATTLYVGNLYVVCAHQSKASRLISTLRSFYTTEEQIHELFAK